MSRKTGRSLAVFVALWMGRGALANAAEPKASKRIVRYSLDNGVEVVLKRETGTPLVAVVSSVDVGNRHDPPGYEGLAHYVEHLVYRGNFEFRPYQEIGSVAVNGHTLRDRTEYQVVVQSSDLERVLWLEARRFSIGLSELNEREAELEAEVVLRESELRPGREDERTRAVWASVYPPDHPYLGRSETTASLERLGLSEARWFFEQTYTGDHIRLVLVGDFEEARARELIEKYWSRVRAHAPAWQSSKQSQELIPEVPAHLSHTLESAKDACHFASTRRLKLPSLMRVPSSQPMLEVRWALLPEDNQTEVLRLLNLWVDIVEPIGQANGTVVAFHAGLETSLLEDFAILSIIPTREETLKDAKELLWRGLVELQGRLKRFKAEEKYWEFSAKAELMKRSVERTDLVGEARRLSERSCTESEPAATATPLNVQQLVEVMKLISRSRAMVSEYKSPSERGDDFEVQW